jgi:hypothetical protein
VIGRPKRLGHFTLKALSFFEDGDLGTVPNAVRDRLGRVRSIWRGFRFWHRPARQFP